jgi:hypothetical protein
VVEVMKSLPAKAATENMHNKIINATKILVALYGFLINILVKRLSPLIEKASIYLFDFWFNALSKITAD